MTVIFAPFLLAVAILLVVARQMDVSVGGSGGKRRVDDSGAGAFCVRQAAGTFCCSLCAPRGAYPTGWSCERAWQNAQRALAGYYRRWKTAVTSKRVTLRTAKETVSVNGDPRHYRAFVQQLYNHAMWAATRFGNFCKG